MAKSSMRPQRLYRHIFRNGAQQLVFVRVGGSPCEAKRKAFEALEAELVQQVDLPRQGWRLSEQADVTHLVTGH